VHERKHGQQRDDDGRNVEKRFAFHNGPSAS
jgi:hypothetical protein